MGFLYVDGHVRVFHGKAKLPKTHVARMRLSMPATTDYWVNDAIGEPIFVVTAEANAGPVKILPAILNEARSLLGERRLTVVFDRGGWSANLFAKIVAAGFDLLTYRKGRSRRLPRSRFCEHKGLINGRAIKYTLADKGVYLLGGKLRLRQVTRLSENGHQTSIVTSRRDLPAVEVAYRMLSAGGRSTSSSTCARSMRSTLSSSTRRNRTIPRARFPIRSETCWTGSFGRPERP